VEENVDEAKRVEVLEENGDEAQQVEVFRLYSVALAKEYLIILRSHAKHCRRNII